MSANQVTDHSISRKALLTILATTLMTGGCASQSGGHGFRWDQQPGQSVDLAALGVSLPLCLRSDPDSLKLTADPAGDNLRKAVWIRHDGTQRIGTWYAHKKAHIVEPQQKDVRINLAWPTIKKNAFLQAAAHMVFAGALVKDEDTPGIVQELTQFQQCQ
ncbi:hypothetical protein ACP6NF_04430 [Alcaligenes faecalis]|uniref:hypothetical protein n=1 Tax=Alcaligenes faecalis TaxID=511 RepID=UPI0005A889D3|nr:hypothetical protein [Alcaligenes faecalis]ATI00418.1 hypothetical protein CPY64_12070 [Alcaligenes faecalis]AYZ93201.1 hypothetical protein EGY22_17840 [Alcaligenes faecalis]MCX5596166.1 hypothetical protein [Alcaligenes faecalis]QQC30997.1 hypothetical protein I6H81_09885 [Alcaligenes faecalis]CAJ0907424.1 Lipoprotein [Alcaligenes faecalis subsp. faecalis]